MLLLFIIKRNAEDSIDHHENGDNSDNDNNDGNDCKLNFRSDLKDLFNDVSLQFFHESLKLILARGSAQNT